MMPCVTTIFLILIAAAAAAASASVGVSAGRQSTQQLSAPALAKRQLPVAKADATYRAVRGTLMVRVRGAWPGRHYACVASSGDVAELQELRKMCSDKFVLRELVHRLRPKLPPSLDRRSSLP